MGAVRNPEQDSQFSLKVINEMLAKMNCEVETAEHGQSAVKVYQSNAKSG